MKKVSIIMCAVSALVLLSCEKENPQVPERQYPDYSTEIIPQQIKRDFLERYPEAKVTSAYEYGSTYQGVAFIDNDGLRREVVYKDGKLTLSEKWYDVDNFLSQLPRPVLGTYLATGIHNESFVDGQFYVVEIERAGLDQKQYEIHCSASFKELDRVVDHLVCHLVISEDGTLLISQHGGFVPTIYAYDMEVAIESVREMYPTGVILGACNTTGAHHLVYIRDKGLVKTVKFYPSWGDYAWVETRYSLPRYAILPGFVRKAIEEGDSRYPERKLFDVFYVESREGEYYGLTFGTELNNSTFYLKVE